MSEAEELKKDLEEIDKLMEEESKTNPEYELRQIQVFFDGVERLLDKYLEYKKSMFPQEKDLERMKYRYWMVVTLGVTALVTVVLIMIFFLSTKRIMSSEGVSFLLGTIVGYLFSTLTMVINGLLKPDKQEG
ncbi:hypothetical protein [Thermococcus sp.]|uniref:hypothetical protein n=1 Tax=Thermococcus sp. TaxID=35749 RepID=UPI0025EDB511|nr:hypothetical protein [Thermococcus sp.]